MLLTEIFSDEEGHLRGQLEGGRVIPLHCPTPEVFLGQRNFPNGSEALDDVGERMLTGDLIERARNDPNHYYFIGKSGRTEDGIFAIPYLVF